MPGVSPRALPGALSGENCDFGALDVGPQGLLAYGSQTLAVVVDPVTMQLVQTLDFHSAGLTRVRWHYSVRTAGGLCLASGDAAGTVVAWDVGEGAVSAVLHAQEQRAVAELRWHPDDAAVCVVLREPARVVVWDIRAGGSVNWAADLAGMVSGAPLRELTFDPFDSTTIGVSTAGGWAVFLGNFQVASGPPALLRRYHIGSGGDAPLAAATAGSERDGSLLQVLFSERFEGVVLLLMAREIVAFDFRQGIAIASTALARNRADFARLLSSALPLTRADAPTGSLFASLADATLTRWTPLHDTSLQFQLRAAGDVLKVSKVAQPGLSGVTLACDTCSAGWGGAGSLYILAVNRDGCALKVEYGACAEQRLAVTVAAAAVPSPGKRRDRPTALGSAFRLVGMLPQCAPITSMSINPYDDVVALGTRTGSIQLLDLSKSRIIAEHRLAAAPAPIRGIRWISPTRLLWFGYAEQREHGQSPSYRNYLSQLDTTTGDERVLRKSPGRENTYIRGLRISPSTEHVLVLLKEQPFEVWHLPSWSLVPTNRLPLVTALEWCYTETSEDRECFIFSLVDGSLHKCTLRRREGDLPGRISAEKLPADQGLGLVSALAAKGDLVVSGDVTGTVKCWLLRANEESSPYPRRVFATNRGLVRRIKFARNESSHRVILVLFAEGDFAVLDLDDNKEVISSARPSDDGSGFRAIDLEWASSGYAVMASSDGTLRVFDTDFSVANSPASSRALTSPLMSPFFIPPAESAELRLRIELGNLAGAAAAEAADAAPPSFALSGEARGVVASGDLTTAQRCLLAARFFGDLSGSRLWQIVLAFMEELATGSDVQELPKAPNYLRPGPVPANAACSASGEQRGLPQAFGLLANAASLRADQAARVGWYAASADRDLRKTCAFASAVLGDREQAVKLLLATSPEDEQFRPDSLQACVIASQVSAQCFKNTSVFVAAQFLGLGLVDDAAQLLCLIGEEQKACGELMRAQRWSDATLIAKRPGGSRQGICEVEGCRADALVDAGRPAEALEVYMSVGLVVHVFLILAQQEQHDTARLLLDALLEQNLVTMPRTAEGGAAGGSGNLLVAGTANAELESALVEGIRQRFSAQLKEGSYAGDVE